MPARIDNKANLTKNRHKFKLLLKRFLKKEGQPVVNFAVFRKFLQANRGQLGVAQGLNIEQLIQYLTELDLVTEYKLNFSHDAFRRYAPPEISLYTVVASFYQRGYLSHYSALFLHQLTTQIPKTIYLNWEQSPKPQNTRRSELEQPNIDQAFQRPQRKTNNYCTFEDQTIIILNGKHTQNLGVHDIALNDEEIVAVTGLERTLIDIAVRPSYAGGAGQVLKAFEKAKEQGVSINRLASLLKKLDYVYPYHQVIGFYLERAGYSESQVALLERLGQHHDFYLDYALQNPDYNKRWRLFIPKGF